MSPKIKETIPLVAGVMAVFIATLWLFLQIRVWDAQGYSEGGIALRILGASALIIFIAYATWENWAGSRKYRALIAQLTAPRVPALSDLEIQGMISMYPHQTMATVWLNSPGSWRFDGRVVMHNCSQGQMKVKSLQNLKMTLGQNTTLFSDRRIDIEVEVGPKTFPEHSFSIDLDRDRAEKILSSLHGVSSSEVVKIVVSGNLIFSYSGREHTRPVGMVFNTEARR